MSSTTAIHSTRSRMWSAAQYAGIATTFVLVGALVIEPDVSLHILWDMVIPLLPAVFLVNPMLWRNVCPLATLNTITGAKIGLRVLRAEAASRAWIVGLVLLMLMVPARRFLFNTNGAALSATIIAVAVLAIGSGLGFARRAGFCNAICPVLPVEKLYGQAPLMSVPSARCSDCSLCTRVGCIDLAVTKTVAQTLGPARRDLGWLATPFGIFAAAFPGFIIAFFTLDDGPVANAAATYGQVLLFAMLSYAVVATATSLVRAKAAAALPVLGGTSFIVYYWLSAPNLAAAYGAPYVGPAIIRLAATILLVVWWWRFKAAQRA